MSQRWTSQHPQLLQLYTLPTPNGQKVSIALEELGIPYEVHRVDIGRDEQFLPEFLAINPNNKIPAIVDPDGPDGEPLTLFESGAILLYLAEKTGRLLPAEPARRIQCIQWLMFQMAGIGPMFGQFGHFHKYAGDRCNHPYPKARYGNEARRLLGVVEQRLAGRKFIMDDDFTIADIATFPWVDCLIRYYDAADHLGLDNYPQLMDWYRRCMARPASQRGKDVGGE
ncbi:glutathione S-transferase N-terminal domain-containing protein [Gallaecimonas sp. GXIMD4217]|uniref:glutathione S-transferase N-terminal domain-containing protein n=1 Tax=Gallaecimonas sp. GXIMD4217 TaxID=3131927 RepID=UPI00311AE2CA